MRKEYEQEKQNFQQRSIETKRFFLLFPARLVFMIETSDRFQNVGE